MEPAIAGAVIGFGGAFAVAVTTQLLAGRRQRADLEVRLQSDRLLADLDEARRVVDIAFEQLSELDARLFAVQRAAQAPELRALQAGSDESAKMLAHSLVKDHEDLDSALYQFHVAARGALVLEHRIEIRFGRNDLHAYYWGAVSALILAVTGGIRRRPLEPESKPDWQRFGAYVEQSTVARNKLADEARRVVGLTLAPTETPSGNDAGESKHDAS